MIAYYYLLL